MTAVTAMHAGVACMLALAACARPQVESPEPPQLVSFSVVQPAAGEEESTEAGAAGADVGSLRGQTEALNADCLNRTGRPCVKGMAVATGGSEIVFYRHPEATGAARPIVSEEEAGAVAPADSFEWLLRTQTQGGAVESTGAAAARVEAHYVYEQPLEVKEQESPAERAKSKSRVDAAVGDPAWPLRHMNYYTARKRLDERLKQLETQGKKRPRVIVAQMDTGYTPNCQYADDESVPTTGLEAKYGRDFFTDPLSGDARDPLTPPTWVPESRQPGHGTRTATALLSPHKVGTCKPRQPEDQVFGVAYPDVTLWPVRVADGILLGLPKILRTALPPLDQRVFALSLGIEHASRGKPFFPEKAQVISISMGGESDEPSDRLPCVAGLAERSGVIIVAAAGQLPAPGLTKWLFFRGKQPVAFPGRYASTIAVSGSTIHGEPWKDACHGKEVDVTAPAEYVWRGNTECGVGETVGHGRGTSFATALTAGVAAMWVRYHGYENLWNMYGPALSSAFRWVLKNGGTRTPVQLADELDGDADLTKYLRDHPGVPNYRVMVRERSRKKKWWETGEYGRGLIDADRVLATPLPSREDVCKAEHERRSTGEYGGVCPATWDPAHTPSLDAAWKTCAAGAVRRP